MAHDLPPKPKEPAMSTKTEAADQTDLQAHLTALRAEVASLAKLVAETAETRARTTLKGLAVAGAEPLGEASAKVDSLIADAKSYADRKPMQALGIAAGVGLLVGLIVARR